MRQEFKEFFEREEAQFVKEVKARVKNLDDILEEGFDAYKDLYLYKIQELRDIYKFLYRLSEHLEKQTTH